MKKDNKKMIIIIGAIILLAIVGVIVYFIITNNMNKQSESGNYSSSTSQNGEIIEKEYSIESTWINKIEKDGIEVSNMNLHAMGDQLQVTSTLKNNTSEKINGYYIEIDLLDKSGNQMTTIADNSTQEIEAGQSIEIQNSVIGIENADKVANAKIVRLEKNNIGDTMEKNFENMIPEEMNNQ